MVIEKAVVILELANRIMEAISIHPGDYSQHDIDTRTKETPSTKDLEEMNHQRLSY